jgi:hypothetical protein
MTPPRWELSRAAGFCAAMERKKNRTLQKRPVLLLRLVIGSLDQA